MASKTLPDGRRVLVGSKADPESSRYTPRTATPQANVQNTLNKVESRANELIALRDAPTTTTTGNQRYSRYTQTDEATTETPSFEDVHSEMLSAAQGEINALKEYESTRLKEQAVVNQQNDRSTSSINTLTGLAGSTEANIQQQKTTDIGNKANEAIRKEAELNLQTLLGNVRRSAVTEARALREEARLDEETRLKNRTARQAEAASQLTNLAAGGVTFEGLKGGDPESFAYLASQFGGEEALKGAFVLNTPQEQILDKRVEGGKYVIAKQNPVTGKITVETVDLGLPPQFTKTVDAGNRILAIPDNWSGDPSELITIPKGLTPGQAQTDSNSSAPVLKETQSEKNALGFYLRGKDAVDTISTIEDDIKGKSLTGQAILEFAPNFLQPQENQVYRQLQRQFTEARLRKESGAAIPPAEYEADAKTYFAQPGDTNETLARKEQARAVVLESLRIGAGNAYKNYFGESTPDTSSEEVYQVDGVTYVLGDDGLYYPQ